MIIFCICIISYSLQHFFTTASPSKAAPDESHNSTLFVSGKTERVINKKTANIPRRLCRFLHLALNSPCYCVDFNMQECKPTEIWYALSSHRSTHIFCVFSVWTNKQTRRSIIESTSWYFWWSHLIQRCESQNVIYLWVWWYARCQSKSMFIIPRDIFINANPQAMIIHIKSLKEIVDLQRRWWTVESKYLNNTHSSKHNNIWWKRIDFLFISKQRKWVIIIFISAISLWANSFMISISLYKFNYTLYAQITVQ